MIRKFIQNLLVGFLFFTAIANAQEIQTFTLADFDLRHNVKYCLVSTDYGKEEYDFNKKGFLTKSVTRYNDKDYDVVYYQYKDGELAEKRSESYRNNTFDPSTSIAHFYQIDSTENLKIQERIFSYDKEFLDEYIYEYDDSGDLASIRRTNNDGTDITQVEHKKFNGEYTVTYLLNEIPVKSVRTSTLKFKNKPTQKIVLTKEFLKGQGNYAFEEVFDMDGKLMAQQEFEFNVQEEKFEPTIRTTYEYDDKGRLIAEIAKSGNGISEKEYLYQYDKEEDGNWIKQIVTPDNTYTTRKITYYKLEPKVAE
jgi:YD repeat-containing protein